MVCVTQNKITTVSTETIYAQMDDILKIAIKKARKRIILKKLT